MEIALLVVMVVAGIWAFFDQNVGSRRENKATPEQGENNGHPE